MSQTTPAPPGDGIEGVKCFLTVAVFPNLALPMEYCDGQTVIMESTDVSPIGIFFFNVLQLIVTFTECVFTLPSPAQHIQEPHRTHKSVFWNSDHWRKAQGHMALTLQSFTESSQNQ